MQPVHRLREEPPANFRTTAVPAGIDQEQWSRAYWERARLIALKYTFGTQLPDEPLDDFRIQQESSVPDAVAARARLAYWNQLRKMWVTPDLWVKSYSFSLSWIRDGIEKGADWMVDLAKGVWRSVRD